MGIQIAIWIVSGLALLLVGLQFKSASKLKREFEAYCDNLDKRFHGNQAFTAQSIARTNERINNRIGIIEFRLNHPAQYKVGDRGLKWVVTKVEIKESAVKLATRLDTYYWEYTATNVKTGEVQSWGE